MNYAKITTYDVNNGPGFRVTLWVSGCSIKCKGCHNQELWDYEFGQKFNKFSLMRVVALCKDPHISGLTICGGEPLDSLDKIIWLTKLCDTLYKYFNTTKSIWLYTGKNIEHEYHFSSEYIFPPSIYFILKYINVIVDGPFIESLKDTSLAFRGSKNQRLIDVQKSLKEHKIVEI